MILSALGQMNSAVRVTEFTVDHHRCGEKVALTEAVLHNILGKGMFRYPQPFSSTSQLG